MKGPKVPPEIGQRVMFCDQERAVPARIIAVLGEDRVNLLLESDPVEGANAVNYGKLGYCWHELVE